MLRKLLCIVEVVVIENCRAKKRDMPNSIGITGSFPLIPLNIMIIMIMMIIIIGKAHWWPSNSLPFMAMD